MGKKLKKKVSAQDSVSSMTSWDTESNTSAVKIEDNDESPENTDAEQKDSLERLDERTDVEKALFHAVDKGDYEAVEKIISENQKDIDVNHKDLFGHDILTHAVETKKKKMISLVLNIDPDNVSTEEALLHAIKEDKLGIVLMLLYFEDHKKGGTMYAVSKRIVSTKQSKPKSKQKKQTGSLRRRKGGGDDEDSNEDDDEKPTVVLPESFDDSEYGWGMTPFMQAAIHGRYEILQVLYNRGDRLPEFHYQSCKCSLCRTADRDLDRTQRRINLLKALCNPTYMIFMAGQDGSYDPVFEALELSRRCKICEKEEPEFSQEYKKLFDGVSRLPVDLMSMCRTTDETMIFLNQREGYIGPSSMPYPRLATCMSYEIKELVSHPNVQFFLETEFYGPIWKTPHNTFERIVKLIVILLMMIFFPVVQLFLWFSLFCCSGTTTVKFLLSPVNKARSKLAANIGLSLLLLQMNQTEKTATEDSMATIYVRYIVVVYSFALLVELIRRFMLNPSLWWKSGWNIFDLVLQVLLWTAYTFWGITEIQNLGKPKTVKNPANPKSPPVPAFDRRLASPYCFPLLEECVFAVASTLATLRLLRWYTLSPYLGPFQAGIARMGQHVKTVVLFMLWTVLSFGVSSKILFRPYIGKTKYDEASGQMKSQPTGFSEIDSLFLDFYVGDIGPDKVEIFPIIENYSDQFNETVFVKNEHKVTNGFTIVQCIMWNIIGVKFLQESVTGLFGSTGEKVLEAKDIEWRYDRAKEMLHYIQDGHLAPPFNLIPNGACMASFFGWIYATTCGKASGKTEAGCTFGECCYLRDVENPDEMEQKMKEYPYLMRNLFLRYFKTKKHEDDEKATKEDVGDVESKVKELRELCKTIVGYKSPLRGQSNASDMGGSGEGKKPVQPHTQPSESTSQQAVQSNKDLSSPKSTTSTPKSALSTPKSAVSTPKSAASTPKPASSTPKSVTSDPKTVTSTPKSMTSTPQKAVSGQKTEAQDSVQVVVSPKSKSKNRMTP